MDIDELELSLEKLMTFSSLDSLRKVANTLLLNPTKLIDLPAIGIIKLFRLEIESEKDLTLKRQFMEKLLQLLVNEKNSHAEAKSSSEENWSESTHADDTKHSIADLQSPYETQEDAHEKSLNKSSSAVKRNVANWKQQRKNLKRVKSVRMHYESQNQSSSSSDETNASASDSATKFNSKSSSKSRKARNSKKKSQNSNLLASATSVLRKQFRISGVVGPDKLSYPAVARQIKEGRDMGFREEEIISGVLNAVGDKTLRNYLEMRVIEDGSLKTLCEHLRMEYQGKTPTEYFQELSDLRQGKEESANTFVMRALELRDKIIFTAEHDEGSVPYDQRQVKLLFLSTLKTGLRKDVAVEIDSYLKDPKVSDVELRNQINKAETSLRKRQQKDEAASKLKTPIKPNINAITEKDEEVKNFMKQMQEQMTSLSLKVESLSKKDNKQPNKPGPRPKCSKCKAESVEKCNHCMKCGQEGHISRGCFNRSGNEKKLQ